MKSDLALTNIKIGDEKLAATNLSPFEQLLVTEEIRRESACFYSQLFSSVVSSSSSVPRRCPVGGPSVISVIDRL